MKAGKGYNIKRLLSIILALCLLLPLLPTPPVYASYTMMTEVTVNNDQLLDSTYRFLVNGKRSKTGPLDGDNCTAELVDGTLKLHNYKGKSISVRGQKADLNIELVAGSINTIEDLIEGYLVGSKIDGLKNYTGGDTKINATERASLFIYITSLKGIANGIACGKISDPSGLQISGEARVIVDVETGTLEYQNHAIGINKIGGGWINILDNAYLRVVARGNQSRGIVSSSEIRINTSNKVEIDSFGTGAAFWMDNNANIQLRKAEEFTYRDIVKAEHPSVEYSPEKFLKVESRINASPGFPETKQITYRYGDPFTMEVNNGSGSGKHLANDHVTIIADKAKPNLVFNGWEGADGLEFLEGTSKADSTAIVKMPYHNVELTATYKGTLFTKQPMGGYGATGEHIPFNWKISDFYGDLLSASLEVKKGEEWENVNQNNSFKYPGSHDFTVLSQDEGAKTYRLNYDFYSEPTNYSIYSKEFTMRWVDTGVKDVTISPATATVKKGDYCQFTAEVHGYGVFDEEVTWNLEGGNTSNSWIDRYGRLSVGTYEPRKTLTVTATSKYDTTKSDTVIVNLTKEDVTKYTLNVVNGAIVNGNGTGLYEAGEEISIKPYPRTPNREFDCWVTTDNGIYNDVFHEDSSTDDPLTIYMPSKNVILTGKYYNPNLSEELTGSVSIKGDFAMDEVLSAEVEDSNNTGNLTYTWHIGEKSLKKETFFLGDEDDAYGNMIPCFGLVPVLEVTSDSHSGSIYAIGEIIGKGYQRPPTGLTSEMIGTGNSGIIHGTTESMEYCYESDDYWYTCQNGETKWFPSGIHYVRYKEGPQKHPSEPTIIKVLDYGEEEVALTGTVQISGTRKFGETLTAKVVGGNNEGTLKYTWWREGSGTTYNGKNTYVIGKHDIGQSLRCEITSSVQTGSIEGYTGMISKADGPEAPKGLTPVKPTLIEGTNGKITGTKSTMEYADNPSFDNAKACGDPTTIGLTAGTYFVRLAETDTHEAGMYAQVEIPGQTDKESANAAISRALALIPEVMSVDRLTDINFINVLNNIGNMAELGIEIILDASGHENIANDGAITYGNSAIDEIIIVKIKRDPGTERSKQVRVLVPADNPLGTVWGYASWNKLDDNSNITVSAKQGEEFIGSTYTDEYGIFQLVLDVGTYDIVLSKPGYLERTIPDVSISENISLPLADIDNPISLLAGDVNGDRSINANDLSVLLAAFNKTTSDAGYNEAADLNGDGSINANDLSMLLSNFNKTISDYPTWTLP